MPLSYSAAETLYRLGRYREISSDIGDTAAIGRVSSLEHRALLAEVLLWTEKPEAARHVARAIDQEASVGAAARARCEFVLGSLAKEAGATDEALHRMQNATRLATQHGDVYQAALASLTAFRLMAECHPPAVVKNLLPPVRAAVTRAGQPHLLAFLHEVVACHESQAGNFDEAARHLRTARAILDRYPNAWVLQHCAINAFCNSWFDGDLDTAEACIQEARALTKVTGAMENVVSNNEAHLLIHRGDFSHAADQFQRVIHSADDRARLGAIDGYARLALAIGDLADCEASLQSLIPLHTEEKLVHSFTLRCSLVTRLKLLLRQNRHAEAMNVAVTAAKVGTLVGDRNLIAVASMLKAETLLRLGRPRDSAVAICDADSHNVWSAREHLAAALQVCVAVLEDAGEPLADRVRSRARRLWIQERKPGVEAEFSTYRLTEGAKGASDATGSVAVGYETADAIAAMFDLAYSPSLLGAELTQLVKTLECGESAQLSSRLAEHHRASSCSVPLGRHRGREVFFTCEPPASPTGAVVLTSVLRLARAAVSLERYRQEERRRAALWPADSIETEAGALFVAEEMQAVLATARRIASANVPVLITGETGTGKEVLARLIHAYSPRAKAPFLPFNCTATPKDMLDSQLFGHRRGAFTGAIEHFPGVIRSAAGGTLFLDEIGESTLDIQPKLLRFLESNEIHPIGDAHPQHVDVRIVAATNADLDALVSQGRFREDLFYRLNVVCLHLPPLRDRRVEIPALANHYLGKYAQEYGKGNLRLAEETMEYLVLYRWPGNVRQLANEVRRLAVLAEAGAVLMPEHLSAEIAASRRTLPASARVLDPAEVVVRLDQPMAAGVQHLERAMIQWALRVTGGRMEETADLLGLSRKGLYLKRRRYGFDADADGEEGGH